MLNFAQRMGIVPEKAIQIDNMDDALKNRLYNYFVFAFNTLHYKRGEIAEYIADELGLRIEKNYECYDMIRGLFSKNTIWYLPYEVFEQLIVAIQRFLKSDSEEIIELITKKLNSILCEEKSGYRLLEGKFIRVTSETELEEIHSAMHSSFDSVDAHISKALALFSDRQQPDYENSIKESISAVESMCAIITGSTGKQATLGTMLDHLEEKGVKIHGSMKEGFKKLYGFANDERGIRHGGKDEEKQPEEDARYMLVTCSAFVNYLKDKYAKAQSGGTT